VPPSALRQLKIPLGRIVLSVRDVGFGFPLFFAIMIEVVTAFGPVTLARFAEVTASTGTDNVVSHPGASGHVGTRPVTGLLLDRVDERVAAWMSERLVPRTDGGAMTLQELHADYANWCRALQLAATCAIGLLVCASDL
jgi:hypothetical protein